MQIPASGANVARDSFGDVPTGTENIVVKTATQFQDRCKVTAGASITLVKRIPSAAGLGGASSNAAATIFAAIRAWRRPLDQQTAYALAADIGSDVPFFLQSCAAVCRGRGERIESLSYFPKQYYVIVRPPVGLSTAKVFAACTPADRPVSATPLLSAIQNGAVHVSRRWRNRLQEAAEQLTPWVNRLRDSFQRLGVPTHQMTGSGSSYFGVCHHRCHARFRCQPLASHAAWHRASRQ